MSLLERVLEQPATRAEETNLAQRHWAETRLKNRLRIVCELRHRIAENAHLLAQSAALVSDRPLAEKLVSEVLPLADACRWLESNATRVLAPRRHGRSGRPFWLQGMTFEVQRQPFGKILIIGPGNYPLFLPAVQALQALVAGNSVQLKPAPCTRSVALAFAKLITEAGLPEGLLTILPESVTAAEEAMRVGVDKVVFTGASENGRDVLTTLAATNTPSVMELSGEDAVVVLADADLDLVTRALRFGTWLNDGETCIAPRRLVVVQSVADDLLTRLTAASLPRLPIERVHDTSSALLRVNAGDFALGCSLFSRDIDGARLIAAQIKTGFVLINDLIVPTADPRMPFGGTKASGFGTTRGAEGLLEMTFPHVVAVRSGKFHPHFLESSSSDIAFFEAYISAAHGRSRWPALLQFFRELMKQARTKKL